MIRNGRGESGSGEEKEAEERKWERATVHAQLPWRKWIDADHYIAPGLLLVWLVLSG
jgi:hypothetical protein